MLEENNIHDRIISSKEHIHDLKDEDHIRPQILSDFVGQSDLVSNLKIFIQAAQERKEALEHILFYGPPGVGKTTLSMIIAHEIGSNMHVTSGPIIERPADLAALLTSLQPFDILFIDEIHRMRPNTEEILYSAMEDGYFDIMLGKGTSAKAMRITLEPFTLVGATTKLSALSSPLRDRFGSTMKLGFYNEKEMHTIIKRSARILNLNIEDAAAIELGKRSRGTPRIGNRLLRRVRDFAQIEKQNMVDLTFVQYALSKLFVDSYGLDDNDKKLLTIIIDKFSGGPVGLTTLAAALSEEVDTIETVYEPFLLQMGFLERTSRGRKITDLGKRYIYK